VTDYVPQILTVVGTLAGSLGGVALTQRHQRQMVRMERAEKRRAELRTHIVEFLTNADEWASHMDITIIVVWKTTERDMVELSNSETANRAGEQYLSRIRRATTEIRNAALPLLRVTIEDPQPIRWWQIRRRRAARRALAS
jgi:hypothetical protein